MIHLPCWNSMACPEARMEGARWSLGVNCPDCMRTERETAERVRAAIEKRRAESAALCRSSRAPVLWRG
jgi:hypothetical protein